ncbi:MAG: hypothetical protein IPN32_35635 [Deltaproteobacteria bacterium]|nr:hypothetical protein [Deltaproteobacteria bacterium]
MQTPDAQSSGPTQCWPAWHRASQVGPPQSTSVSSSLETPSLQPGAPVSELPPLPESEPEESTEVVELVSVVALPLPLLDPPPSAPEVLPSP